MKSLILLPLTLLALPTFADPVWITLDPATAKQLKNAPFTLHQRELATTPEHAQSAALQLSSGMLLPVLAQIQEDDIPALSSQIHRELHRCGGFIAHNSLEEAMAAVANPVSLATFNAPPLAQGTLVNASLPLLNNASIAQTIADLSAFTNRYYNTTVGKNAADWITTQWSALASGKSWVTVSRVSHSGYNQQSVLLTITGSERPNEVVVLGGHLDSVNQSGTTESTRAPGADDDASGIATLTDIIRVITSQNLRPKRTIKFYGYAAEEVGLRGSKDIANAAASAGQNVLAALQLDMTNYKGSTEDIVLITDYTNASLNSYLRTLISTYQPALKQANDVCGYGCSDHASWHNAGFAAAMPFESRFNGSNPRIHTANDTLANSDASALHALKFAKLGLSFALELANAGSTTPPPGNSGQWTALAASTGQWIYKTVTVPAGATSLIVNSSGGTGDADLYLRLGSNPTTTSYQCRPYKNGNTESCSISNPQAGNWYIGLRAYSSFSGVSLNWQQN